MDVNTIGVLKEEGMALLMGANPLGEVGVIVFDTLPGAVQGVFDAVQASGDQLPNGAIGVLQLDVPTFTGIAHDMGAENVLLHEGETRLGQEPTTLSIFTYALTSNDE